MDDRRAAAGTMSDSDLIKNGRPLRLSQVFFWALRILIAGVFLWAGVAKMRDPVGFAQGISQFQFFPESWINVLAGTVPVLEIFVAGLLFWRPWSRRAALLGSLFALSFALLFAWAWWRGLDVQCACFGSRHGVVSPLFGIVRAFGLLGACAWLYGQLLGRQTEA